ncbi:MAG: hypothetical protein AAFV59_15505, partial [Pseudomonadota bacterium]
MERAIQAQNWSPTKSISKRYHQILAIASATALSTIAAQAEGVVIQSSVDTYKDGQTIKDGEWIDLPTGAFISVINDEGEVFEIREPSVFGAEEAAQGATPAPSPLQVIVWDKRYAAIGGTRGDDYNECSELAEETPELTLDECLAKRASAATQPAFSIHYSGVRDSFRPGGKIRFQLRTDYDAVVSCKISDPELGYASQLGTFGSELIQVPGSAVKHVPGRGGDPIFAPEEEGMVKISCFAVSAKM